MRTGWIRHVLRFVASVLITSGLLMLADAGLTLAWQEPISAIYARLTQNQLGSDLRPRQALGDQLLDTSAFYAAP